jgi:hypothetical protein
LTRARPLYTRALAILQPLLGRDHPDVAMTVNNLAVLERDDGRSARARVLFRRAFESFRRVLGAGHPHTRLARDNHRAADPARP